MAGEWIKVRTNLWNDPRVSQLCDLTNERKATVTGALYWLWASADEHTETGLMPGLSLKGIDRETNISGFGGALVSIGWVEDTPKGIILVRFDEHNGASAKNRAQTAKRVANSRNGGNVTRPFENSNAATVTGALPREEKRREETTSASAQEDSSEEQSGRRKLHGSEEDFKAARWLFGAVLRVNPTAKQPKWDAWANEIRLLREVDGRTHLEICELFKWAKSDSFWAPNIQSPGKLRAKWDTLTEKKAKAQPEAAPPPKKDWI